MKKLLLLLLLCSALLLTACAEGLPEVVYEDTESPEDESPAPESPLPEGGESPVPESPMPESPAPESPKPEGREILRFLPEEEYRNYGYKHLKLEESGEYRLEVSGEGLSWIVYVLDEEFPDAERYIPQVYEPALEGPGSLSLNAGDWLYLFCSANGWTMQDYGEDDWAAVYKLN